MQCLAGGIPASRKLWKNSCNESFLTCCLKHALSPTKAYGKISDCVLIETFIALDNQVM
jgi:hypothetical protein